MALASQSGSPVSRRYMYRRRRRRPGRLILAVLAVIALGTTWMLWPTTENTEAGADENAVAAGTTEGTPAPGAILTPPDILQPTGTTRTTTPATTAPAPAPTPTPEPEPMTGTETTIATVTPVEPSRTSVPIPEELRNAPATAAGAARLAGALELIESRPLEARVELSELIGARMLGPADRRTARESLNMLGEALFFTPNRLPEDPFTRPYVIQGGDSLERIARRDDVNVEWGMIQEINGIRNPALIRQGQRLKLPDGTFHAMVSKREYVLDLWLENEDGRVIIASMPVGLGELNGTPTGSFRVRSNSKLKNPQWKNPRTGEFFLPDDPENPIGERWIGLEGTDDTNRDMLGIGIHGTIDPDSIGDDRSMGCVRMLDADVRRVYDALTTRGSTILITD